MMNAEPPMSENSLGSRVERPTVTTRSLIPSSRMRVMSTPTRGRSSGASRRSLTRTICPWRMPASRNAWIARARPVDSRVPPVKTPTHG